MKTLLFIWACTLSFAALCLILAAIKDYLRARRCRAQLKRAMKKLDIWFTLARENRTAEWCNTEKLP